MDTNLLHIPYQSGYKVGYSCESLLLRITNDVLMSMDSKHCTVLLLLDLSAAFDTVDHARLLEMLNHEIGLQGTVYHWFSSFLKGRQQAINIKGCKSDYKDNIHGVPQGSVLGPPLFNIYVRNLIRTVKKAGFSMHGYADDHQVFRAFHIDFQYNAIRDDIPKCLNVISTWMKNSFLKLNGDKSQLIVFAPRSLADKVVIERVPLNTYAYIPISTEVVNLGVRFDSQLTFSSHIGSIISQSYRLIRNLASVRKYLSCTHMKTLVNAIIVSRIDNCNSLLYGLPVYEINRLQKLQNACARLIYGRKKNDHVSDILHELHWLPVPQRIIFKTLCLVFKCLHKSAPLYLSECLHVKDWSKFILFVPISKTAYGNRAFCNSAPRLWNALPTAIRTCSTLIKFKSLLKHHLFTYFTEYMAIKNRYIQ